jgi:hypothetical protein
MHTASFTVPQCSLTETSQYFREACGGGRLQVEMSRTLRLLDVDVEAFNSYVCWANRKILAMNFDWDDEESFPYAMGKLVTLWLLTDRVADAKLRNAVTDAMIDLTNVFSREGEQIRLFPPHMTVLIWSTLAKGRALRRLVVDHYVQKVKAKAMEPHWDECHPNFIKSLAAIGMEGGPSEGELGNDQPECPKSKYHEHGGRTTCEDLDFGVDNFHFE